MGPNWKLVGKCAGNLDKNYSVEKLVLNRPAEFLTCGFGCRTLNGSCQPTYKVEVFAKPIYVLTHKNVCNALSRRLQLGNMLY